MVATVVEMMSHNAAAQQGAYMVEALASSRG